MPAPLKTRPITLMLLALTLAALYGVSSRIEWDTQWLATWNQLDLGRVQFIYAVLVGVIALAIPFEPRLRRTLSQPRVWAGLIVLAALVSFLVIRLLEGDQEHRVFITPFSLWIIIAHAVTASAVLVLATLPAETVAPSAMQWRGGWGVRSAALILIGVLGLGLALLHVAGIAEFMPLDLPDEPFNGSIATNFALNGDLSCQYIGSAYGSPDVVFPRYYLVMGLWLRLLDRTDLWALRSFPLLVGGVGLVLLVWGLRRIRVVIPLSAGQILVGAAAFIALTTFVRASHNLRMDIMLALQAALVLPGFLIFFQQERKQMRWLVLMGAALFLGFQGIPTTALPLNLAVGVALTAWWLRSRDRVYNLRFVAVYALVCAAAIGLYYLLQFLPDPAVSWARYREFVTQYASVTGVGTVRFSLDNLIGYAARFNLIFSPVELATGGLAFGLLWRSGRPAERALILTLGLCLLLMVLLFFVSYSYLTIFAPFTAYAIARAFESRRAVVLFGFVLMPALLSAPIHDLSTGIQTQRNTSRIAPTEALIPYFPEGSVIVGEVLYWFALHRGRTYIAINGL
ncbi:MAG: hypothetical protein JNM70_09115, partial [Anaerolineae bacterium]|nr:hypothetical protein [Anaerolineae bacterium]